MLYSQFLKSLCFIQSNLLLLLKHNDFKIWLKSKELMDFFQNLQEFMIQLSEIDPSQAIRWVHVMTLSEIKEDSDPIESFQVLTEANCC